MRSRLRRAGPPLEVTVLVVIAVVLALGCLGTVAFPMAPDAPRGLMAAIGASSVVVAGSLVLAGPRWAPLSLHTAVVVLTCLRTLMVATAATERGLMLGALGFVWTAVYVAFFFRERIAWAYAGLMTVALGVGLLLARAPTDVSVWITISAMVWVATGILANLGSRLRGEAHTDALTGLLNRTGFAVAAARQRAVAARRGEQLAIAVLDLDDFKAVNDRGGHAAGDRLLIELAAAWTASLRPSDLLARFGGDEFVLLLSVTEPEQVDAVLERLAHAHPAAWTPGAVLCTAQESLDEAIARADERLYQAKRESRERIVPSPGRSAASAAAARA